LSLISALGTSLRVLALFSCVALTNWTCGPSAPTSPTSVLRLAWCKLFCDWWLQGLGEPSREPAQGPQEHLRAKLRRNLRSKGFFPSYTESWSIRPWATRTLLSSHRAPSCRRPRRRTPVPPAEAIVTEPFASTHRQGLGGCGRGCPSLERLVLSHGSLLSDKGWAQAAGSLLRLQHFNLSSSQS
ncbi:hypothetical protein HPG69_000214, partial [Diceros bicornis minor]